MLKLPFVQDTIRHKRKNRLQSNSSGDFDSTLSQLDNLPDKTSTDMMDKLPYIDQKTSIICRPFHPEAEECTFF